MFRTHCLVCNSKDLVRIMDLGMHPFADTFIPESRLSESEPVYPLTCDLCKDCGHVQTSCITDPNERYLMYDYSYTSSSSNFARTHWTAYANEVTQAVNLPANSSVIEIGSNDGFLAEQFKNQGHRVLGVDPSDAMAKLAKERGVDTFVGLLNSENAKKILETFGKAKLIVANNVFNHSDAPQDFMKAVEILLEEGGTFVFESPYWLSTIETKRFDQVYHEHVSYFTVKSAKKVYQSAGLDVSDVKLVNYHGGSIRVFGKRAKDIQGVSATEQEMIQKETSLRLFEPAMYEEFMKDLMLRRNQFLQKIYELKSQGKVIIAVGAPAKGNTFLNFYNLSGITINYVTDSSPQKQGKYTPLTRIPIVGDDVFSKHQDVYALLLSWNLSHDLKKSLEAINPNIQFLAPL